MVFFTLYELTKSSTATRYGIDNTPDKKILYNLNLLVDKVLDPLRELFKRPIIVNSGYRCPELNELVGGSPTSQHKYGQAADIQSVGDKYNRELFELARGFDYDQLIVEDVKDDGSIGWIHISYVSPEKNRHQILEMRKINGKTIYRKIA